MKFNLFSLFGQPKEKPEEEQATAEEVQADVLDSSTGAILPPLNHDAPIELFSEDGAMLLSGRLSASSRTELVITRVPGMINLPTIPVDSRIRVSAYTLDLDPCNLFARVAVSNMVECRVRNLEVIPYFNQRLSFRQPLNVPAAFYAMEDTYFNNPHECRILDISTGGARVLSSYVYSEDDVVRLRAELVKGNGYMSFTSKVIRITSTNDGSFIYGLLFAQLKQRQINDMLKDIRQVQQNVHLRLTV